MSQLGRQWTDVVLPSKGILYGDQLPGGVVKISAMTLNEEQLIASRTNADRIEQTLFENCLNCSPMNHLDLLHGDRDYLMYAIRIESFGPNYSLSHRCEGCGKQVKIAINLRTGEGPNIVVPMKLRTLAEDAQAVYELILPVSKLKLQLRRLTGRDQAALRVNLPNMSEDQRRAMRFYNTLSAHIVSVDGKQREEVGVDLNHILHGLHAMDSAALNKAINDNDCGMVNEVTHKCPVCGWEEEEVTIRISSNFFRPGDPGVL